MKSVIPFNNDAAEWDMEIELDGTVYRMAFHWNALKQYWTMDLYRRDLTEIIRGVKLIIDYDILGIYSADDLPKGRLICLDVVGNLQRIGREDMGKNVLLIYVDQAEVEGT